MMNDYYLEQYKGFLNVYKKKLEYSQNYNQNNTITR